MYALSLDESKCECRRPFCSDTACECFHVVNDAVVEYTHKFDAVTYLINIKLAGKIGRFTCSLDGFDFDKLPPADMDVTVNPWPNHAFNLEWEWQRDAWTGQWYAQIVKIEAVDRVAIAAQTN